MIHAFLKSINIKKSQSNELLLLFIYFIFVIDNNCIKLILFLTTIFKYILTVVCLLNYNPTIFSFTCHCLFLS